MKPALALLVLCALVIRGEAQDCYSCLAISNPMAGQSGQPDYILGDASCADSGSTQPTTDCSVARGCLQQDFEFVYNIDGSNVRTRFVQRACGTNVNQCVSGDDVQELLDEQKAYLDQSLPAGVTLVSADGTACTCTGNECNGGTISALGGAAAPGAGAGVITLCLLLTAFLFHYSAI